MNLISLSQSMMPENKNHFDFKQLADDEDCVIIETHVANIQGAMIWLLSAGSQVRILQPTALVEKIKNELSTALASYQ